MNALTIEAIKDMIGSFKVFGRPYVRGLSAGEMALMSEELARKRDVYHMIGKEYGRVVGDVKNSGPIKAGHLALCEAPEDMGVDEAFNTLFEEGKTGIEPIQLHQATVEIAHASLLRGYVMDRRLLTRVMVRGSVRLVETEFSWLRGGVITDFVSIETASKGVLFGVLTD